MMRMLVMDDMAKAKVKHVLDHALDPAHYYRPHKDARVPGDDPRFVAHLDVGYRCVFTITEEPSGKIFRHLSISVDGKDMPNPLAAYSIADMFGFTGWDGKSELPPRGWMLNVDKADHCIVLGQDYVSE
jgi:hypothetical protein